MFDRVLGQQIAGRLNVVMTELEDIQGVLAQALAADAAAVPTTDLVVGPAEPIAGFSFTWPDSKTVEYESVRQYTAQRDGTTHVFVIGAERGGRAAYGRDDRGRMVAFVRERSGALRPLVEFAESDLDPSRYVAGVPQPAAPRSLATDVHLDQLQRVPHLAGAELKRTDEVYDSSVKAPSLRLVVGVDDAQLMLEHAYWVGRLRGSLR